jgi:hypothetical protein
MEPAVVQVSEIPIEILPPEKEDVQEGDLVVCLCCLKPRSRSWIDDDGCGICEECLAS